jgi:hypothetical protein
MVLTKNKLLTNKTTIIPITELVGELSDTVCEKLSGGSIITPQGTAGNIEKNPQSAANKEKNANIPNPADVGLIPFYPPLPQMKLTGLRHLKGNDGIASKNTAKSSSPV